MPSLRVLFTVLFLIALALIIVVVFMDKSKPIRDAQSYAEQHPNCNETKFHSEKNDLIECFLNFESIDDIPSKPLDADTLYIPMAKLIGERFPQEFPLRIKHIFSLPSGTEDSIWISGNSITITKNKNSDWRNEKNGCRFPGHCPVVPFNNSKANAILPGKILKIEQENSLFSITIYHGENIYSKTDNLSSISNYVQVSNIVTPDSILGVPTAKTFVEITRNGKYETWEKFYAESRATD
jgi:hypothetical protein